MLRYFTADDTGCDGTTLALKAAPILAKRRRATPALTHSAR